MSVESHLSASIKRLFEFLQYRNRATLPSGTRIFPEGDDPDMNTILNTPALLLVGGMGTRLHSVVQSTPKPLASVGNRTFLEILITQLRCQGIRRVVMCTGYLADRVEGKFGNGDQWGIEIEYSKETRPLGTAGAVKLAQRHVRHSTECVVMNGDSFLEVDLSELVRFHHAHGGLVSMAVVRVADASRYGTVQVGANERVVGFVEKAGSDPPGLVNGGVYVFNPYVLEYIPKSPASLERDIFPQLLSFGVYALEQRGSFIDIGTPEDYARAQRLSDHLYEAALYPPHYDDQKSRRQNDR
jgi:NDP-sugar pyrophosphorylase family protein